MTSAIRTLSLGAALLGLAVTGCRGPRPRAPDWADQMARHAEYATAPTPTPAAPRPAPDAWVCPMHPEIKQSEPGTCPICGMQLVRAGETSAPGKRAARDHGSHSGSPSHSRGSSSGCSHCG